MITQKQNNKIVLTGNFEGSKTFLRGMNIETDGKTLIKLIRRICKIAKKTI